MKLEIVFPLFYIYNISISDEIQLEGTHISIKYFNIVCLMYGWCHAFHISKPWICSYPIRKNVNKPCCIRIGCQNAWYIFFKCNKYHVMVSLGQNHICLIHQKHYFSPNLCKHFFFVSDVWYLFISTSWLEKHHTVHILECHAK